MKSHMTIQEAYQLALDNPSKHLQALVQLVFETSGSLGFDSKVNEPTVSIHNLNIPTAQIIAAPDGPLSYLRTDHESASSDVVFLSATGPDVISFLTYLYPHDVCHENHMPSVSDIFLSAGKAAWNKYWSLVSSSSSAKMSVILTDPLAVIPRKTIASDAGFDLTLISLVRKTGDLYLYDTGVCVCPPPGFYFDMVPRSSIIKSGYMLANSVGIIDPSYRGSIKVPLVKINPDAADLDLPVRIVQLIPRRVHYMCVDEVTCPDVIDDSVNTQRGAAGFGSTGSH